MLFCSLICFQAEAFQLDVPAFELLEEVEADVLATKAQWSRYGDFLRERDEMANRDWLSMRDQVRSYSIVSLHADEYEDPESLPYHSACNWTTCQH